MRVVGPPPGIRRRVELDACGRGSAAPARSAPVPGGHSWSGAMFGTDPQAKEAVARDRRQKMFMFLVIAVLAVGALFWIMSS
jgi:hypothetical protein